MNHLACLSHFYIPWWYSCNLCGPLRSCAGGSAFFTVSNVRWWLGCFLKTLLMTGIVLFLLGAWRCTKNRRGHRTRGQVTKGISQAVWHHAQYVERRREGKHSECGALVPKPPLLWWALLSWQWLNTCLPLGNEWIPCFALLICSAFAFPINLPLPQTRGFLTFPAVVLSPVLQVWWLAAGAKAQWSPIQSDFSFCLIDCVTGHFCTLFTNDKQLHCYIIKSCI